MGRIGVLSDELPFTETPEIVDLLLTSQKGRLTIQGLSMYPALRPGDRVEISPARETNLALGDLVVFQKEDALVCHRLIEMFEQNGDPWVKTKGDAVATEDPPMPQSRLLGKISRIERRQNLPLPLSLYRLQGETREILKAFWTYCLSVRLFRRLYRRCFRPRAEYLLGIPTSSSDSPRFWSYRRFPSSFPKEDGRVSRLRLLAKVRGQGVGSLEISLLTEETQAVWQMTHLFVRTAFRGCGIATALLQRAVQLLQERSVSTLMVKLEPTQRPALYHYGTGPAQALFRRIGFVPFQKKPSFLQKNLLFDLRLLDQDDTLSLYAYSLFTSRAASPFNEEVMEELRNRFIQNAARQLLFEKALVEIHSAFKQAGVEMLVLKGMALAYLIYPDPATRPMVDVDLLVHPNEVRHAAEILTQLGYSALRRYQEYGEEFLRFGGELAFQRPDAPFVELHWMLEQYERLKGLIRIDEEALWKRAMTYSVNGTEAKTPCLEDQLLTLSIHYGLVHRFQGLKWLLDIDRLIRTFDQRIDWEQLMRRARRWGMSRLLGHVLWLSKQTFGTPLPEKAEARPAFGAKGILGSWTLLDRWPDRFVVLKRALFPSADWIRYRYRLKKSQALFPYRLLHPILLLSGKFS